jgi:putative peptidoglycan lipid II flippase
MKHRFNLLFQGVGGAALIVLVTQVISKGIGFIREVLFAGQFGVGKEFEYYLIALTVPSMINTILFYQAQNYFIPIYNELKSKSKEEAYSFFISALLIFTLLISSIGLILYFSSSQIISLFLKTDNREDFELVMLLFRVGLITLPLNGIISIISAYLVAEFKFKVTYLSQIWTNLFVILFTALFAVRYGTLAIVLGFIVGNTIQILHLLVGGKKLLFTGIKGRIRFNKSLSFMVLFNSLLIEIASQFFLFIDRLFYSNTDQGGIAALNYSILIFMLPIAIFTTALGSALLPDFALNVAKSDFKEANSKFAKAIELVFLLFIPVSIIFIFSGEAIVSLLYERGKFTNASTILTSNTLFYYSISLPLYALFAIGLKYAYSLKGSTFLMFLSVGGLFVKFFLSYILSEAMHQDGLALSTSITFMLQSILCFIFIYQKARFKINKDLILSVSQFIIYPILIASVVIIVISLFNLTTLILPICFILVYPLILHFTRNRVYAEITSRFIKP